MEGVVKGLTCFFENLSGSKTGQSHKSSLPSHRKDDYTQSSLNREKKSNKVVQTGDTNDSRKSNDIVEKSSNGQDTTSLNEKICYKIPFFFKGADDKLEDQIYTAGEETGQARGPPCRANQRDTIQGAPRESSEKDVGRLLGSNRNISHLVGDAYRTKSITAETRKGEISTHSMSSDAKTECSKRAKRVKSLSESTNVSHASTGSLNDGLHITNEVDIRDGHPINEKWGRSKSTTTIDSSGIYTGSVTDRTSVQEERERFGTDDCRTKRYVKTCSATEGHLIRKSPSEPTFVPKQKPERKQLTQSSRLLNLGDSSVGIFTSGNESLTVSQTSVFSSSEQETRDAIADHTRECLKEHGKYMNVDQRRLERARDVLEKQGLVIILGNEGSGSTYLAWTLLLESNSKEKYNLLDISSHFAVCMHSRETVTILVNDAFGEPKLQDKALQTSLRHAEMCKMKKSSKNVKLIFTVKHHIANQCKQQLYAYTKSIVDLEDPKLQLDSDEMFTISKAIIHDNETELKVKTSTTDKGKQAGPRKGWQYISESLLLDISENALPSGFPKKFKQFLDTRDNIKQGVGYFTHPPKDLLQAFIGMKKSNIQEDLAQYLTLCIIAVCGDKLRLEDVVRIEQARSHVTKPAKQKKTKKKAKTKSKAKPCEMEIPWWIEIINFYAKLCTKSLLESVKTGLGLLKTTYVKEEVKGVYVFAAPCVGNATLITIGKDFPQYILKLSDLQFFKEYISICNDFEVDSDHLIVIDTSNSSIRSEANDKLIELFDSGDIETFSKHQLFRNKGFAQQFLDSLSKTRDWLKMLSNNSSEMQSKCVISYALQNDPKYLIRGQNNLAKTIILHRAWNEKRKGYREWTSRKEYEVIMHCCEYGDEDTYFELRSKYNIHVNYKCLLLAIRVGSYQIVEEILESIAADVTDEQICKCMELALFKYAEFPLMKRKKIVDSLQRYVSVDYKIKGVDPAIHLAHKRGNARVIVALERFGGDINVTNEHGKTILHEAVQINNAPFLDIALKHGADQNKTDKKGILPIHECAKQNHLYPLQLLMGKDNKIVSAKDTSGRQPLHHAAINNSYEVANCLIRHGAEVDAVDDGQRTPLHYAAESGKGAVIHSLLSCKADVAKLDKKGQSAWIIACQGRNIEGIRRLLRDGMVDVNVKIDNMFPLHLVASIGNIGAFNMLLRNGANINKVTLDTGDTVLHIAIRHGHNELIKTILELDESLASYRNKENEMPLHTAARHGNSCAVDALLKVGANRSPINKKFQKPIDIIGEMLERETNKGDPNMYNSIFRLLSGQRPRLETAV